MLLAVILFLTPTERTLGMMVKPVLLHGALTYIGFLFFFIFGSSGLAYLIINKQWLFDLATRSFRISLIFWIVDFLIWVPVTYMLWGNIFQEPRAIAFVWVMLFLGLCYLVSLIVENHKVMSLIYAVLGMVITFLFSGLKIVLHPQNPVEASGVTFKFFFGGVLLVCLAIGVCFLLPLGESAKAEL